MNLWLTTEIADELEELGRRMEHSSAQHARWLIINGLKDERRKYDAEQRQHDADIRQHPKNAGHEPKRRQNGE
jgi:hypothetical protein